MIFCDLLSLPSSRLVTQLFEALLRNQQDRQPIQTAQSPEQKTQKFPLFRQDERNDCQQAEDRNWNNPLKRKLLRLTHSGYTFNPDQILLGVPAIR